MGALTLMQVYLWVGPIQLLHAIYSYTRKGKPKPYYTNLKRYASIVISYFLTWIIIGNEQIANTEILGNDLSYYHIVVTPGLIALYYSYISLKKYPQSTFTNSGSC